VIQEREEEDEYAHTSNLKYKIIMYRQIFRWKHATNFKLQVQIKMPIWHTFSVFVVYCKFEEEDISKPFLYL
jgi:hypothetical protein